MPDSTSSAAREKRSTTQANLAGQVGVNQATLLAGRRVRLRSLLRRPLLLSEMLGVAIGTKWSHGARRP